MHTDLHSRDYSRLLSERRATIETAMADYLSGSSGYAGDQQRAAAHQLLGVLLAALAGSRNGHRIDAAASSWASRFGDGLSPVLKDVFGVDVPESFIAGCIDSYWAALRE